MAEGEGRTGLIALPVAVLLLALLTVWVVVFSREDGGGQAIDDADDLVAATSTAPSNRPGELAEVWRAPAVAAAIDGVGARATRLWVHEDTVTLVSTAGVTGYGTVDGERLWVAEAPPGAGRPCAAADTINSAGTGAVLWTAGTGEEGCSVLGVLDTATGDLLWSERFGGPVTAEETTVTVGEQTVTVNLDAAGTVGAFHRFAADTGEELPLPAPPEDSAWDCVSGRETVGVHHAGSRIAVLTRCDDAPELSVYHADTGQLEWTHPAADAGFAVTGILAGDPVLLLQEHEVVAYSETGDELWRLPAVELNPSVSAVAGEALVTQYSSTSFTGYGLVGGERLWQTELPENTELYGVDATGEPVLGHSDSGAGLLRLLRLDPATGADTPVGTLPLDPRRAADTRHVAWDANQLYVLAPVERDGTTGLRLRAFER
ncbi:PQQ-binding-like beta-propeller repeat protein [Streptomyces sp. MP131-18]|uniref:outer membrane protein assembly factor BamB family protein n=1 Tax=Streptomyces sp. MP131-18 TaxID=1857892 RepID=UPI00097BD376|nr:PQQ-binding-like beta-propeller repeat protein [Streptomyces sp. MP131-18]ONK13346.1 hypothetical protein STBA_41130 [Streptomyces sp. MP131-18]